MTNKLPYDIKSLLSKVDSIEPIVDSKVLSNRGKVKTPLAILNGALGGGIPFGTTMGIYGPPGGGKSTFSYLTAAEFQRTTPDGIVVVIDQENSADPVRLASLGLDPDRVFRILPTSINDAFNQIIQFFNNVIETSEKIKQRIPVVVIWDTISKGRAEDGENASRMDAMNRARVIKSRMNDLDPLMEKVDALVMILNQIIVSTDRYGNASVGAGGGAALSHNEHLRIFIEKDRHGSVYDEEVGMMASEKSFINMDKSKLSPVMRGIVMTLDSTKGGAVDSVHSLVSYYVKCGWIKLESRRYNIFGVIKDSKDNNYPYANYLETHHGRTHSVNQWIDKVRDDHALELIFQLYFMDKVSRTYELQREVIAEYRDEVIKELIAFKPEAYVLSIEDTEPISEPEEVEISTLDEVAE